MSGRTSKQGCGGRGGGGGLGRNRLNFFKLMYDYKDK